MTRLLLACMAFGGLIAAVVLGAVPAGASETPPTAGVVEESVNPLLPLLHWVGQLAMMLILSGVVTCLLIVGALKLWDSVWDRLR